jgi:hypothetical protein
MPLSTIGQKATTFFRTYGNYVEQHGVIRNVGLKASWVGGIGGIGLLTASDYFRAQPDEKEKVLIRDGLVLGATAVGTFFAARRFMPLPNLEEAKKLVNIFVDNATGTLKGAAKQNEYYQSLVQDLENLKGQTKLKVSDYKNIVKKVQSNPDLQEAEKHLKKIFGEDEEDFPELWKDGWFHKKGLQDLKKNLTQKGDALNGIDEGEIRKMGNFFMVGGLSVISGLLGGVAANWVNKVKDPNATVNMVKEGIFQFVANIALCAVGASAAILAMSPKSVAQWFVKMGALGKGLKTLGIGAGLSLGIVGGGAIANKLGTHVVNPLCDKIRGIPPQPNAQGGNQGKRKIEFWDLILHLDDVPTALALAGMEIVEPFIPLFFAFSGYRTGIGYRNGEEAMQNLAQPPKMANIPPFPVQQFPPAQPDFNPYNISFDPTKPA